MMEEIEFEDVEIGEDKPQIEAKTVMIESIKTETIEKDGKKTGEKIILNVRHPDVSDRLVEISGTSYIGSDKKVKTSGLWWKIDNEGKLPYRSAVGYMLRYFGKKSLKEMKGEQVETVNDEKNYLVVKAY